MPPTIVSREALEIKEWWDKLPSYVKPEKGKNPASAMRYWVDEMEKRLKEVKTLIRVWEQMFEIDYGAHALANKYTEVQESLKKMRTKLNTGVDEEEP
jgi:hypothetical protein